MRALRSRSDRNRGASAGDLTRLVPRYATGGWLDVALPTTAAPWLRAAGHLNAGPPLGMDEVSLDRLEAYAAPRLWVFDARLHYFFCDVHADADAFTRSLVASGGIEKRGPGDTDLRLTPEGRSARLILGGDCFDKGPDNLRLLALVKHLLDLGVDLTLLAGNHDLRTILGLAYAGRHEPEYAHLFVRMGRKTVPFLREIHATHPHRPATSLSAPAIREYLFPPETWYADFPDVMRGRIADAKLDREVSRIRDKAGEFEHRCQELGLSLPDLYSAVQLGRRMLLDEGGSLRWFYDRLRLVDRAGSFLFVHAGVDDQTAQILAESGISGLNQAFDRLLHTDLFELYHGAIGNAFRTKYRTYDFPLTERGVRDLNAAGIYAVIHGHRNIPRGQRVVMRRGMLNVECDASIDCNTRVLEGLRGVGGAVTILRPEGQILGVSTDCHHVKVLDLAALSRWSTVV